ncbi:YcgN family cysteine cluster protein [Pseudoxanthobacter sp.]|uniref:YcgN family cysteine cluster protein n=1 Tax=Pseudoxanthobacter sp. TaxID=1925742 RepID=UPI002FE10574
MSATEPFWRTKTLDEMNEAEWESLCDGCGRCCLNKLEDWDTGAIAWTNVACTLLDTASCRCRDYPGRSAIVPDCIRLTPQEVETLPWLPPTCGYRLVADGEDLPWWHPLVSGDPQTVHEAGISVRGRAISEDGMAPEQLEDHLVLWPGRVPRGALSPTRPEPKTGLTGRRK